MSHILHASQIEDRQQLMEIVVDDISEIQYGANVLDTTVGNKEYGYIDIVAADEEKRGMLFFLNFSGDEIHFLSSLKCLQWVRENQTVFHKLYAGKIDFNQPATVLFIAPHFTPSMQKVLLNLKEGRIVLLQYNCFHDEKETKIFIEKIADSLENADSLKNEKSEKNQQDILDAVPKDRWSNIHMVRHEDKIWMFNERGELIISKLSPKGFHEISRTKIIEPTEGQLNRRGGVCWSHPAFAYRKIYVRNDRELLCIDLAARE